MTGSYRPEFLKEIPGQDRLKKMLFRTIENGRLPSTMLFRGANFLGKFASALQLVRWIKCQNPVECDGLCHSCRLITNLDHPDVEIIIPLPTELDNKPEKIATVLSNMGRNPLAPYRFDKPPKIGINAIRKLNESISLTPNYDGGKWAIVRDADMMTLEASNAFLKTLEEPPEDSYIILTSSKPDFLLPTILSRAQSIQFRRLTRKQISDFAISTGIPQPEAQKLASQADGNLEPIFAAGDEVVIRTRELGEDLWAVMFSESDLLAFDLTDKIVKETSLVKSILENAISFFRDHLLMLTGNDFLIANTPQKARLKTAAEKFQYTDRLIDTMNLLENKARSLRFYPQYDLFILGTITEGRRILKGKSIYGF
ncbi:hypothetical protein KAH81_09670 [bacterium]|nr:hypothetical protein [bacterium]